MILLIMTKVTIIPPTDAKLLIDNNTARLNNNTMILLHCFYKQK